MKKFKYLIFALISTVLMGLANVSYADEFKSIDMDIYIDKEGLGHVKEVWDVHDDNHDATEKYKAIPELRGVVIRDFSLNSNGVDFTEKAPWNIDASFDEKANHYGILEANDGYELAWGITNFGDNVYTLEYIIDPLVIGLNDYDMVYFEFIGSNLDPKPQEFSIKIKADEAFDEEVNMWAFGFDGDIHNEEGIITARSNGRINEGTIMLRFPKGSFASSYKEDKSFRDYANEAIKDSKWEENEGGASVDDDSSITGLIIGIVAAIGGLIIAAIAIVFAINGTETSDSYEFINKNILTKERKLKDQYFRDIPYKGPIEDTFLIATNAYPYEDNLANYLNAFMLKWVHEGAITFGADEGKILVIKTSSPYIVINHRPSGMNPVEAKYFEIIEAVPDKDQDGKIHQSEVTDFLAKNDELVEELAKIIDKNSLDSMVAGGYLTDEVKKKKISSADKPSYKHKISFTSPGINLYENFIKFKNYLKDYSLIKERGVNEVKLWDDFMIYAALYGISQEVFKNLNEIYPAYENSSVYTYYMINGIHNYSRNVGTSIASSAAFESFNAAGGGGAASFGGGGGSFGGGGGGGSR